MTVTPTNATDSPPFTFTPGQEVYVRRRGKIYEAVVDNDNIVWYWYKNQRAYLCLPVKSERIRVAPRTSAGLSYLIRQLTIVEADLYAEIKRVKELRDEMALKEGL